MTLAKNAFEAYSTYIFTHKKKRTQHQTFFSVQTHESFECSNSFLAQSTGELWNSKVAGK